MRPARWCPHCSARCCESKAVDVVAEETARRPPHSSIPVQIVSLMRRCVLSGSKRARVALRGALSSCEQQDAGPCVATFGARGTNESSVYFMISFMNTIIHLSRIQLRVAFGVEESAELRAPKDALMVWPRWHHHHSCVHKQCAETTWSQQVKASALAVPQPSTSPPPRASAANWRRRCILHHSPPGFVYPCN